MDNASTTTPIESSSSKQPQSEPPVRSDTADTLVTADAVLQAKLATSLASMTSPQSEALSQQQPRVNKADHSMHIAQLPLAESPEPIVTAAELETLSESGTLTELELHAQAQQAPAASAFSKPEPDSNASLHSENSLHAELSLQKSDSPTVTKSSPRSRHTRLPTPIAPVGSSCSSALHTESASTPETTEPSFDTQEAVSAPHTASDDEESPPNSWSSTQSGQIGQAARTSNDEAVRFNQARLEFMFEMQLQQQLQSQQEQARHAIVADKHSSTSMSSQQAAARRAPSLDMSVVTVSSSQFMDSINRRSTGASPLLSNRKRVTFAEPIVTLVIDANGPQIRRRRSLGAVDSDSDDNDDPYHDFTASDARPHRYKLSFNSFGSGWLRNIRSKSRDRSPMLSLTPPQTDLSQMAAMQAPMPQSPPPLLSLTACESPSESAPPPSEPDLLHHRTLSDRLGRPFSGIATHLFHRNQKPSDQDTFVSEESALPDTFSPTPSSSVSSDNSRLPRRRTRSHPSTSRLWTIFTDMFVSSSKPVQESGDLEMPIKDLKPEISMSSTLQEYDEQHEKPVLDMAGLATQTMSQQSTNSNNDSLTNATIEPERNHDAAHTESMQHDVHVNQSDDSESSEISCALAVVDGEDDDEPEAVDVSNAHLNHHESNSSANGDRSSGGSRIGDIDANAHAQRRKSMQSQSLLSCDFCQRRASEPTTSHSDNSVLLQQHRRSSSLGLTKESGTPHRSDSAQTSSQTTNEPRSWLSWSLSRIKRQSRQQPPSQPAVPVQQPDPTFSSQTLFTSEPEHLDVSDTYDKYNKRLLQRGQHGRSMSLPGVLGNIWPGATIVISGQSPQLQHVTAPTNVNIDERDPDGLCRIPPAAEYIAISKNVSAKTQAKPQTYDNKFITHPNLEDLGADHSLMNDASVHLDHDAEMIARGTVHEHVPRIRIHANQSH